MTPQEGHVGDCRMGRSYYSYQNPGILSHGYGEDKVEITAARFIPMWQDWDGLNILPHEALSEDDADDHEYSEIAIPVWTRHQLDSWDYEKFPFTHRGRRNAIEEVEGKVGSPRHGPPYSILCMNPKGSYSLQMLIPHDFESQSNSTFEMRKPNSKWRVMARATKQLRKDGYEGMAILKYDGGHYEDFEHDKHTGYTDDHYSGFSTSAVRVKSRTYTYYLVELGPVQIHPARRGKDAATTAPCFDNNWAVLATITTADHWFHSMDMGIENWRYLHTENPRESAIHSTVATAFLIEWLKQRGG